MTMRLVLAITACVMALIACSGRAAEPRDPPPDCDKDELTQTGCLNAQAEALESRVAQYYDRIHAKLLPEQKRLFAEMEAVWASYRASVCDFDAALAVGNSWDRGKATDRPSGLETYEVRFLLEPRNDSPTYVVHYQPDAAQP